MKDNKLIYDIPEATPFSIYTCDIKGNSGVLLSASEVIDWLKENPDGGDKPQRAILERVKEEDNPVVVIIE